MIASAGINPASRSRNSRENCSKPGYPAASQTSSNTDRTSLSASLTTPQGYDGLDAFEASGPGEHNDGTSSCSLHMSRFLLLLAPHVAFPPQGACRQQPRGAPRD